MFHTGIGTATKAPEAQFGQPVGAPATAAGEPRSGELFFQRCTWCGSIAFRRLLCPTCASTDLAAEPSEGVGVVQRTTVVGRHTAAEHHVSVIDMAEGFSVRCKVVGPTEKVRPGARVKVAAPADPVRQELVFQVCDSGSAARLPGVAA